MIFYNPIVLTGSFHYNKDSKKNRETIQRQLGGQYVFFTKWQLEIESCAF